MEKETGEEKKHRLRNEVREKTAGYIVTALGLVAGLAWNDAINTLIKRFIPLGNDGLAGKIIYAIVITLVIVIMSNYLLRIIGPKDVKKK